jgi:hypothetical protein
MSEPPRIDEQAISKVAETVISTQLDSAEKLDVDIRTDPLKMMGGKIDSVSIAGKNLVTQHNLQIQEMELHSDRIDIDLFSILFGKVELNQPVNTTGKFVVTEGQINQNLKSDLILSKIIPFELNVGGQIVSLKFQPPMELHIPTENKLVFSSNIKISEVGQNRLVRFTGVISPRTANQDILMEKFSLEEGQSISLNVLVAFMNQLQALVNATYLEYNGARFRIKEMDVKKGRIALEVEAKIDRIP